MTTGQVYWGRTGYVEIEGAGRTYGNENGANTLDFKFDITKYGSMYSDFNVSILGLNSETINQLTVWKPQDAASERRQVKVFAGYEVDGKPNLLASGGVWSALPTPPPEMWLNMSCLHSLNKKVPVENPGNFMGSVRELFNIVAKEMGYESKIWNVRGDVPAGKQKFRIDGLKADLAQKFAQKFNLIVYDDDGTLTAIDQKGERLPPKNPIDVNINTGLLAMGNVSVGGATVRVRLTNRFKLYSWVNLKSTLIPKASGLYYVIKTRYVGHMRGDEWYTELEMLREEK